MNKLVSVIVPIYNVESYLNKCIQSILNQTYSNLEIILVDDGSTDNCSNICDSYSRKDSRVKVLHKKNGGLSDARNAGIKMATGEYISFIDSDDYINETMYEKMIKKLIEYDADIVECGVSYVLNDKVIRYTGPTSNSSFNSEQALKELILGGNFKQTVWNKVYSKQIVKSLLFEKGKINEDEFWTYIIFSKVRRLATVSEHLYYYTQRPDSIMGKKYCIRRLDAVEARYERLKFIKENYNNLFKYEKKSFFFYCLYHYQCMLKYENKENIIKGNEIIQSYLKDIKFTIKEQCNMSLKEVLWMNFAKFSIEKTSYLRNKLRIGI